MTEYDIHFQIKQTKSAFDLDSDSATPDLRNLHYDCLTDHLNCPICQQPFLQPMTTLCGHTFCKECIMECLNIGSTLELPSKKGFCPLDRMPIDSMDVHDLFPTPLLITNMVDDLIVYCLNNERGCPWKGHRWEIEGHVKNICGYTGVRCNGIRNNVSSNSSVAIQDGNEELTDPREFQKCNLLAERRFTEKYDECVHLFYECQFCGTDITRVTEDEHLLEECAHNYTTCNLCNSDMIPFKCLQKHEENCKKSGRQFCPAHEIGCGWTGCNELALEIHLQKDNCVFNLLLPFLKSTEARILEVESENKYLHKQIQHILGNIVQGRVTNLGYSESLEEIGTLTNDIARLQDQTRLLHLDSEIERLRSEIDEKINPFMERNATNISEQQNILNGLVNDNYIMKDEINLQRSLINSLRKQVQFYSFRNRQQTFSGMNTLIIETDEVSSPSRSSSEERINLKL